MSERETLDVDILIVGGGPAGLSAALRLAQLQKRAGKTLQRRRAREGAPSPARICCRERCSIRARWPS